MGGRTVRRDAERSGATTTKPSEAIGEASALLLTDGLVHLDRALVLARGARQALEISFESPQCKTYHASELAGAIHEIRKAEDRLARFASVVSTGMDDIEDISRARTGAVLMRRAKKLAGRLSAFKRALDNLSVAEKLARKKGL